MYAVCYYNIAIFLTESLYCLIPAAATRGYAPRGMAESKGLTMTLSALLHNSLLINPLLAWIAAQIVKAIVYAVANKSVDWKLLTSDGGMPSGHSATVTALAVTSAMDYGFGSAVFAVSFILAIVVMHDAMGVRLEAGKHAKAINELMALMYSDLKPEEKFKEFLGHTPLQVFFGALLGLGIAVLLG